MVKLFHGIRTGLCFALVITVFSMTIAQPAFCSGTSKIENQQNDLVIVEKQPVSEEELSALGALNNDVDQVTAGHRPGHRPAPVHGRVIASDIFFWTGFTLIMLSAAIYPY